MSEEAEKMSQQNMPYFGGNQQQNQQNQQQATQPNQQAGQQNALTEKDMVEDMLGCHKALANSYSVLILEASCPKRTHGWYQMPTAQQQEIATSKQQFAQMQTQLQ